MVYINKLYSIYPVSNNKILNNCINKSFKYTTKYIINAHKQTNKIRYNTFINIYTIKNQSYRTKVYEYEDRYKSYSTYSNTQNNRVNEDINNSTYSTTQKNILDEDINDATHSTTQNKLNENTNESTHPTIQNKANENKVNTYKTTLEELQEHIGVKELEYIPIFVSNIKIQRNNILNKQERWYKDPSYRECNEILILIDTYMRIHQQLQSILQIFEQHNIDDDSISKKCIIEYFIEYGITEDNIKEYLQEKNFNYANNLLYNVLNIINKKYRKFLKTNEDIYALELHYYDYYNITKMNTVQRKNLYEQKASINRFYDNLQKPLKIQSLSLQHKQRIYFKYRQYCDKFNLYDSSILLYPNITIQAITHIQTEETNSTIRKNIITNFYKWQNEYICKSAQTLHTMCYKYYNSRGHISPLINKSDTLSLLNNAQDFEQSIQILWNGLHKPIKKILNTSQDTAQEWDIQYWWHTNFLSNRHDNNAIYTSYIHGMTLQRCLQSLDILCRKVQFLDQRLLDIVWRTDKGSTVNTNNNINEKFPVYKYGIYEQSSNKENIHCHGIFYIDQIDETLPCNGIGRTDILIGSTTSKPIAYIHMNIQNSSAKDTVILTSNEYRTLIHEFGHVQNILQNTANYVHTMPYFNDKYTIEIIPFQIEKFITNKEFLDLCFQGTIVDNNSAKDTKFTKYLYDDDSNVNLKDNELQSQLQDVEYIRLHRLLNILRLCTQQYSRFGKSIDTKDINNNDNNSIENWLKILDNAINGIWQNKSIVMYPSDINVQNEFEKPYHSQQIAEIQSTLIFSKLFPNNKMYSRYQHLQAQQAGQKIREQCKISSIKDMQKAILDILSINTWDIIIFCKEFVQQYTNRLQEIAPDASPSSRIAPKSIYNNNDNDTFHMSRKGGT